MKKPEVNVLWELGKKGPRSIFMLAEPIEPAELMSVRNEVKGLASEKRSYYWSYVRKIVRRLEMQGLVRTRKDPENRRNPTMVEPTFQGLVLYLRESKEENRFILAIENYQQHLPFSKNWDLLEKELGQGFVFNALEQAIMNLVDLRPAIFKIKFLDLEFQSFLEDEFTAGNTTIRLEGKNEKVAKLLMTQQKPVLRDSYVAYLAIHDLIKLRKQNKRNVEELLPNLDSEKELAYFESREVSSNSLFKGNRLKEFFPKYASAEYLLTGMFVENLLWQERHIERKHDTYDFEVEF